MCGIFGMYNIKNIDPEIKKKIILSTGMKADYSGKDSWGVGYYKKDKNNADKFYTHKGLGLFYDYAKDKSKDVKLWAGSDTFLGHSRSASKGAVTIMNSHPFIIGDWCCLHNGCHYAINKFGSALFDFMPKGETDSEMAFCYLLENKLEYDAFAELDGWYNSVMFNYNTKEICCFTNSHRFYKLNIDTGFIFASTEEALSVIQDKIGGEIEQLKDCINFYRPTESGIELYKSHKIESKAKTIGYTTTQYYGFRRKYNPATQEWDYDDDVTEDNKDLPLIPGEQK